MGCPPVRGDNPQALRSGLSYIQVDKHGITISYHLFSVDIVYHEIFRAEVGMGGIKGENPFFTVILFGHFYHLIWGSFPIQKLSLFSQFHVF